MGEELGLIDEIPVVVRFKASLNQNACRNNPFDKRLPMRPHPIKILLFVLAFDPFLASDCIQLLITLKLTTC